MKIYTSKTLYGCTIIVCILTGLFVFNTDAEAQKRRRRGKEVRLVECRDKTLSFKILCSKDWRLARDEESVSLYLSEKEGEVVILSVTNPKETGLDISDLTPSALKYVFNYADGFKYTSTSFHTQDAIFIKAKPIDDPNAVLLDYFLLRKTKLYRISFFVRPYYNYDKYYPIFIKMIRSFRFID